MKVAHDRYALEGELGRGGMAVVYRARDTRHGRNVAVKVMLPSVTHSVGAERFLREIETAARLQHPHIVPVFDSGTFEGQTFFVMPLIEGESLRAKLQREGQLAVEEAVRIVLEIADALDYAHGEGIVHRDLKPENVLLSRGHALLADFGIALVLRQAGDLALTQEGTSLGTPTYMSPELAVGEGDVGPASDVYALACILFELLTGKPPFTGRSHQAILVKQFTTDAPRVRSVRADVPGSVDAAIACALEREPEKRYQTARAFADALAARTDVGVSVPRSGLAGARSIVVLPFDNLSADADDAYLADGLTEEITSDLSRVQALRVIARNSATAARQRTGDLKEIARILDVRYLLEGSVRRSGKQMRITAQLIDGTTDAHIWAEKYGGTVDDVFEMQARISQSIVEELRTRLTTDDQARRGEGGAVTDAETYELFLRARHMLGQSLTRMPEAFPLLEEAINRDPGFWPAYTAMGQPLVICGFFGYIEPSAAWSRIQELASRALSVSDQSGAANQLLAAVAVYRDWNLEEGRRLYDRALELEPGVGFDRFLYAFFLAFVGDTDGALRAAREGRRLDPLSLIGLVTESVMWAYCGDFDAALPLAERPIEMDPHFPEGYLIAGYMHLGRKEYARAAEKLERAVELSRRASWPTAKYGCALVGMNRAPEARGLLNELRDRAIADRTISPSAIATLHLHLGDNDEYFHWMNRALDERDPFGLSLHREFLWSSARKDPRFRELLSRVGLDAGANGVS